MRVASHRVTLLQLFRLTAAICLFITICSFAGALGRLRKAEELLLENTARRWGTALLADCAEAGIEAAGGTLLRVQYDPDGTLQAVSVDPFALSRLRSAVARRSEELLAEKSEAEATIPLGSIVMSEFFSGMGPEIRFGFRPEGSLQFDVQSELMEGGVNQTVYRVYIDLELAIRAVTSFSNHAVTVSHQVTAAEMMVVGELPAAIVEEIVEK